jgi:hypothetical protein
MTTGKMSPRSYVAVFTTLLMLTLFMTAVAYIALGVFTVVVA